MRAGPVLLCVGPDAGIARAITEQAVALLAGRDVVVLCAWGPDPLPFALALGELEWAPQPTHDVVVADGLQIADDAAIAACDALVDAGWTATSRVVHDERAPSTVALEVADEVGASLIVAGAHESPDAPEGFLGREARALAHHSTRPVLIVAPDGPVPDACAPALLAFDGSAGARRAVGQAARLLARRPAIVATAWVPCPVFATVADRGASPGQASDYDPEPLDDRLRDAARRTAHAAQETLASSGWTVTSTDVRTRRGVWRALTDLAELDDAAVVVAGTRGHLPVVPELIGSVAEGVLRHAERPVLLVQAR